MSFTKPTLTTNVISKRPFVKVHWHNYDDNLYEVNGHPFTYNSLCWHSIENLPFVLSFFYLPSKPGCFSCLFLMAWVSSADFWQIFIHPSIELDLLWSWEMHCSVKLIATTSILMSYRAEGLSYGDLIKLCHGDLIKLDLHLEMFLCPVLFQPSEGSGTIAGCFQTGLHCSSPSHDLHQSWEMAPCCLHNHLSFCCIKACSGFALPLAD